MTISLCIITKNEEKYLDQCLSSVKGLADEIIIVDSKSIDRTREIAKKYNAKIFNFDWVDDFSKARNESLKHATNDWILVLDADEILDEGGAKKLKELVKNTSFSGFTLDQRSYLEDYFEGAYQNKTDFESVKKYPYYISNSIVRLFKNNLGIEFRHRVHELVEDSMDEKGLKYAKSNVIIHHFGSLKEKALISNKVDLYSKMIMHQLEEHPKNPRYLYQAARMFLSKKDFQNALKHFEDLAKINPNYKLAYSEIAKIYLRLNDKRKAAENFRKSMELNPDNPSPANNLAVVLMALGKFHEAKKILEDCIKKHPDNYALKQNYGECLKNI